MKIGDVVKIKSLDWYEAEHNRLGNVQFNTGPPFSSEMKDYCGRYATITKILYSYPNMESYILDIDDGIYAWSSEMFTYFEPNSQEIVASLKAQIQVLSDKVLNLEKALNNMTNPAEEIEEVVLDTYHGAGYILNLENNDVDSTCWFANREDFTSFKSFKTKELAERALKRMQIVMALENFAANNDADFEPDWDNYTQIKYYIGIDSSDNEITFHSVTSQIVVEVTYFSTKEMAEAAAEMLKRKKLI